MCGHCICSFDGFQARLHRHHQEVTQHQAMAQGASRSQDVSDSFILCSVVSGACHSLVTAVWGSQTQEVRSEPGEILCVLLFSCMYIYIYNTQIRIYPMSPNYSGSCRAQSRVDLHVSRRVNFSQGLSVPAWCKVGEQGCLFACMVLWCCFEFITVTQTENIAYRLQGLRDLLHLSF